jgi:hypothetical protein
MNNSMMLITSSWGQFKTFKMIPTDINCPYSECIFDVQSKVLAIIGRISKESLHMLPKLTDIGDVNYLKIGKRENGKPYAEERRTLNTLYEYYIENVDEIKAFVNGFAENSDTFNIQQYIDLVIDTKPVAAENSIITTV